MEISKFCICNVTKREQPTKSNALQIHFDSDYRMLSTCPSFYLLTSLSECVSLNTCLCWQLVCVYVPASLCESDQRKALCPLQAV